MSLFDSASLIVTPSGYKEDKLYSIKPTDGSGDLVVTRATTATRVNSDGLVELVPVNLLTYSQEFDNAAWSKYQATITANSITAPNGTLTADSLISSTTGTAVLYRSSVVSGVCTISVYAKEGTNNVLDIGFTDGSDYIVKVNLTTGTITSATSGVTGTITSVGNGWYRVTATRTMSGIGNIFINNPTTISGKIIYIWGAQLVSGTSAKEYFPTTDRLDVPRLDYTNSSCPSILVEPQRTNLVPNPFAYSGSGVAFNTSVVNSPISDGLSTRITKNEAAGTLRYAQQTCSSSALLGSTNYTISAFFKYDGYDVQTSMEYNNSGQWGTTSWVQLINIASTGITLGTSSACTSTIQNYGNGWYRVNVTILTGATITSTPPVTYLMRVASTLSTGQGFLHTAAQLEAGSYATSYIPTIASSVTRNADVISKTGISSLIGQTEGTIFLDYVWNNNASDVIPIAVNGDGGKFIWFRLNGVQFYGNGSSLLFNNTPTNGTYNQRYKLAFVYGQNYFKLYINGTLIGNSTSGTFTGTFNEILFTPIGSAPYNDSTKHNAIALWKTKLTDTELAQLTTI